LFNVPYKIAGGEAWGEGKEPMEAQAHAWGTCALNHTTWERVRKKKERSAKAVFSKRRRRAVAIKGAQDVERGMRRSQKTRSQMRKRARKAGERRVAKTREVDEIRMVFQ